MGYNNQIKIFKQPSTTTITTQPVIHNERTSVFWSFTSSMKNILFVVTRDVD